MLTPIKVDGDSILRWLQKGCQATGPAGPVQPVIKPALNQSQSGIYIDIGLGSATSNVVPAKAGIQETLQAVMFWTPACAGVTKDFAPSGCAK
jgi:hypothetical protein